MTSTTDGALAEQRQTLRLQLLAQRERIAHQLGVSPSVTNGYPRSMTMRFLIRRPDLAVRLLAGFATLLKARRTKPHLADIHRGDGDDGLPR